jgi:N-acyl-D-amino-acid deacylase
MIILRGGTVVDGTGGPPMEHCDVYIENDKIINMLLWKNGNPPPLPVLEEKLIQVIDCRNKIVAPGWIDQHTHYDGQVTWDPYLSPSASCGVTTAIMGNCGIGFAPVRSGLKDREFLLQLVEAVEDIPGAALNVGIDWSWETFPQYLDKLATLDLAMDVGVLIGHAPVRAYILGERASISDRPGGPINNDITENEIELMANVVKEAVKAGAMGFSTSRLILHRDSSGVLTPGSLATELEMLALGHAVASGGGGVIEGVFDFFMYDDIPVKSMVPELIQLHGQREWSWMTNIAKEYNVPFSFATNVGNPRFHLMNEFNNKLIKEFSMKPKMYAQVFTRPQGLLISFDSRMNPFSFTPYFQRLEKEGKTKDMKFMSSSTIKDKIVSETISMINGHNQVSDMFDKMVVLDNTYRWVPSYEPKKEDSVEHTAKRLNVEPVSLMYEWLCTDNNGLPGNGVLWRPMFQSDPNLDPIMNSFSFDHALPGVGDGGAHGTVFTDATANTNLLSWWVRDRPIGKLKIETVIHKSTLAMANLYNLYDRGQIAIGMKADINVIDLKKVQVCKPIHVNDLPTGAPRWLQYVKGYDLTMVSGTITFQNGIKTGKLPGRLVRNQKSAKNVNRNIDQLKPYKSLLSGIKVLDDQKTNGKDSSTAQERAVNSALGVDDAGASALGRIANVLRGRNASKL